MDARLSWMMILGVPLLLCAGCSESAPDEVTDLTPKPRPTLAGESASFIEGSAAAREALRAVPDRLLLDAKYGPTQKKEIIAALSGPEAKLERSLRGPWARAYQASAVDQVSDEVKGWNWLSRSLDWQSQEALEQQNWPLAAAKSLTAIRFGLRLTTGDCFEAVGGLTTAEIHASRLAPQVSQMGPKTLTAVSLGIQDALKGMADPEVTLSNEMDRISTTLQALQTACRSDGYKGMLPIIGPTSHDGAAWIRSNKKKLGWFFRAFRDECADLSTEYVAASSGKEFDEDIFKPRSKRWEGVTRPWRDMTPQIMAGHEAYRKARLGVTARLRLLAVTCAVEAKLKQEGKVPRNLDFLPESLRKDPYGEGDLAYRPGEVTYRLWSVGPNGVDDGGLTDPGTVILDMGLRTPLAE